jgi:hypothetical protein
MTSRIEKLRQFGPAATLLVAYLLVLQGLAVGFATNGRAAASGLFGNSICLTTPEAARNSDPAAPARSASHKDSCCIFHCSGMGVAPEPGCSGETPRSSVDGAATPPLGHLVALATPRSSPLGSRAPPAIGL